MSSGRSPDGIKVRTLKALSGRGGPQRRLKAGAGIVLLGLILMLAWSFWIGLIVVVLGVVVAGVVRGTRS